MKDEYKILIGAIIVILIVLIGALAMSGSNNPQPTATPTVTPTTNPTATAVPGGEGGTPTATPEPTAAPTATPIPTTEPESGVKLTEFGYWITYPPLGPQNWSTNPPPGPGEWNVVYFDPISDTLPVSSFEPREGYYGEAVVHRVGDMEGTVNATIHASSSSNVEHYLHILATYSYDLDGSNLTYLGEGNYSLTFGPGVSEQVISIHMDRHEDEEPAALGGMPDGFLTLTITNVDGGYTKGHNDEYTLNIEEVQVVYFRPGSGHIWTDSDDYEYESDRFYDVDDSGEMVNVTFWIFRNYVSGTLPVTFYGVGYNITSSDYILYPYTFADESSMGIVRVEIDKGLVFGGYQRRLDVYIADSEDYAIGDNEKFQIFINYPV